MPAALNENAHEINDEVLPYSPDAKYECIWHANGVEDHFGLHEFKQYP